MGNIDWLPIEDMPEEMKDGRWLLLWLPGEYWATGSNYAVGFWGEDDEGGDWLAADTDSKSMTAFGDRPTHFAEINPPT